MLNCVSWSPTLLGETWPGEMSLKILVKRSRNPWKTERRNRTGEGKDGSAGVDDGSCPPTQLIWKLERCWSWPWGHRGRLAAAVRSHVRLTARRDDKLSWHTCLTTWPLVYAPSPALKLTTREENTKILGSQVRNLVLGKLGYCTWHLLYYLCIKIFISYTKML